MFTDSENKTPSLFPLSFSEYAPNSYYLSYLLDTWVVTIHAPLNSVAS